VVEVEVVEVVEEVVEEVVVEEVEARSACILL
jgi:hypothetical protein